jgi:hypothetical protein
VTRWHLGARLAMLERAQGQRTDLVNFAKRLAKSFRAVIDRLKITDPVAVEAQRIACLPPEELEAFCRQAREPDQADLRLT